MKHQSLFVVFALFAIAGCTAQVSDERLTGDDGHGAIDPQLVSGPPIVEVAQLTVTNGEPSQPTVMPAPGNVLLGTQDALFLEFTLAAKSHLLTVEQVTITLESPVGGALVDAGGTPYFSDVRLAIGIPSKILHATVAVTSTALILDFGAIRVVPGTPTVAALYIDVANPAPPEDSALTFKGYVAHMLPIEEGNVTDFGPGPWSPPLPDGTVLPIEKIDQENVQGGPQTPVPPSP